MRGGWSERSMHHGVYTLITDLVRNHGYSVEAWGNSREGWWPYLVKGNAGVQIGPYFGRDDGTRLKDLKGAAGRAYGIHPKDVRLGRNFAQ